MLLLFLLSLGEEYFCYCIFFKFITIRLYFRKRRIFSPLTLINYPHIHVKLSLIIITMFLFRIGKEKLPYTLSLGLHKVRYSHANELAFGCEIRVNVKRYSWGYQDRGNHETKFISFVNKKHKLSVEEGSQTIPMTLYFDKETSLFNKKDVVF